MLRQSMTNQIKTICDFYAITQKLKNTVRIGLKKWEVDAERFETVAEHIYGTQMLAFAINSEFELELDMGKVIFMLAFHELAESLLGDFPFETPREEKYEKELSAVEQILAPLGDGERVRKLWLEFENGETKEAKFARLIDKLESNFQIKFYEENGCTDLNKPRTGRYKQLCDEGIAKGYKTFAKMWIEHDKEHFGYDEIFRNIADFVADNKIF